MEGGCHVGQLELHGLEAAYGLPKLLAHGRMFLSCVQAEGCSPKAAGPYVDAAAVHCKSHKLSERSPSNARRSPHMGLSCGDLDS